MKLSASGVATPAAKDLTFASAMCRMIVLLISWLVAAGSASAGDTVSVRMADGFGLPVGLQNGKRYYKARGYRPNGHLGEDWNGVGGGDSDLGDPVHATAHGIVVYARDFRAGWGNVVIIRHAYMERGDVRFVDSLYGHLNSILVREGEKVERGEKVGTIGTAHGQYPAHLHFEMRKDIRVGMFRSQFPRDFRTYFDPTQFVVSHQQCPGGGRVADVPINTFPNQENFASAGSIVAAQRSGGDKPSPVTSNGRRMLFSGTPRWTADTGKVTSESPNPKSDKKKGTFRVDRYEDMRGQ